MEEEWLNRIALTHIPALGPVRIRSLIDYFGSATNVFSGNRKEWLRVPNITEQSCKELKKKQFRSEAELEWKFIQLNQIKPLFLTDAAYPTRLLHCYDPPPILYYKGTAQLNQPRMVSVIGTRNPTQYGKQVTEELIKNLQQANVVIISGLAYGIDALAHKMALQYQIPTIGVLAHGLDTIYPWQHVSLAREMEKQGALLTEFCSKTQPDKHNFPRRNRIVAGMADATIVVETAIKGGSMITAELAFEYNRDLFAVPGKITDPTASGCLQLIQQNKAHVFTSTENLLQVLGWKNRQPIVKQTRLWNDINSDEQLIIDLLQKTDAMFIDELQLRTGKSPGWLAAVLLSLEMKNCIQSLPGKRYSLP